MSKITKNLGACQVGSWTDHPCSRPAVVEIRGIPFCEPCAREQEAYFAIGEMTQALTLNRARQLKGFQHIQPLVKAVN